MSVKNKAMGTPYVVYYIQPSMAANTSTSIGKKGGLYIYINVGLSTLYQRCTLKDYISYLLPT